MKIRSLRWLAILAPVAALAAVCVLHARGFIHFLGIDTQASQNYDFVSGVGPMLLTAIGMTTLVSGMFRHVNCHASGCWRIGRHKIDGTPWCNKHHEKIRITETVDLAAIAGRLDIIISLLRDIP